MPTQEPKEPKEQKNEPEHMPGDNVLPEEPEMKRDSYPLLRDIGGYAEVKEKVRYFLNFFKYPQLYKSYGIRPARGLLLYGPPGTGKTMFAQALANELNAFYESFNLEDYLTMWFGQTERSFIEHFERFEEACRRYNTWGVAYFDEAEQIFGIRVSDGGVKAPQRIASYLLKRMDGERPARNIIFVASSNLITHFDPAFLRAGRFDYQIYVGRPSYYDLIEIIDAQANYFNSRARKPYLKIEDKQNVALMMYILGFVGADVREVFRRATEKKINELIQMLEEGKEPPFPPKLRYVTDEYVLSVIEEYGPQIDLEEVVERASEFGIKLEYAQKRRKNKIGFARGEKNESN